MFLHAQGGFNIAPAALRGMHRTYGIEIIDHLVFLPIVSTYGTQTNCPSHNSCRVTQYGPALGRDIP